MGEKQKVLITGGAGYLGSVMTGHFLQKGFSVTVLDNFRYCRTSLLHLCSNRNLKIVAGDVRERDVVRPLLKDADLIIPLAAVVGAPACDRRPGESRSINVGAVKLINDLRAAGQRVIFPVTNSGYGVGEEGVLCTEGSPLRPVSSYGRQKVEAEKILLDKGDAVAFRLATAFGVSPRMRLDLLVNDFTYRALRDRCIVLFEEHFQRNFIHVRDIAAVFHLAAVNFERLKDQVYNVGLSSANLSKRQLCDLIKREVPELTIISSPIGRDPDQRNYIVSNEKIERAGFRPRWTLSAGIRELLRAYTFLKDSRYDNL